MAQTAVICHYHVRWQMAILHDETSTFCLIVDFLIRPLNSGLRCRPRIRFISFSRVLPTEFLRRRRHRGLIASQIIIGLTALAVRQQQLIMSFVRLSQEFILKIINVTITL